MGMFVYLSYLANLNLISSTFRGFKVILPNKCNHTFKPVSVQAMWFVKFNFIYAFQNYKTNIK